MYLRNIVLSTLPLTTVKWYKQMGTHKITAVGLTTNRIAIIQINMLLSSTNQNMFIYLNVYKCSNTAPLPFPGQGK